MKTICIDAGHGGKDPGAVSNSLYEKNLTLKIANYLNDYLTADSNYKPIMTRTTDIYVSVNDRAIICNNADADLFASIHLNAATTATANGFETYPHVPKESYHKESYKFAEYLVENMKDIMTIRGIDGIRYGYLVNGNLNIKESSDTNISGYNTYYGVVRQAKCPAALIETAFISSATDMYKLNNDLKLKDVALRYYKSICNYFNTKPVSNSSDNTVNSNTKTIYRVQVGAFTRRVNADTFLSNVKNTGYEDSFITQDENKLFKVQVGAFSVKANAENYMKEIKSKGYDAFIVTVTK